MESDSPDTEAEQTAKNRSKIEGSYDSIIHDLLFQEMLSEAPSTAQRAKIFAALENVDPDTALEELETTIRKTCPKLVTELWKEQLNEERKIERAERNRWEKENSYGRHAPEIAIKQPLPARSSNEPDATPKQKNYLKMLGVRDSELLKSLGKSQASALINAVTTLRDSSDLAQVSRHERAQKKGSKSGKDSGLGLFIMFIVVVAFLVAVAKIFLGARS